MTDPRTAALRRRFALAAATRNVQAAVQDEPRILIASIAPRDGSASVTFCLDLEAPLLLTEAPTLLLAVEAATARLAAHDAQRGAVAVPA